MTELERAREYFKNDRYAYELTGIEITEVRKHYAKVELDLEDRHMNAMNNVMGGVYFTICDFAFAVASNLDSEPCVTLGSHAIFMNKNKGSHLICEARCIKDGRRACFYEVNVTDEYDTEIARVRVEGYRILSK